MKPTTSKYTGAVERVLDQAGQPVFNQYLFKSSKTGEYINEFSVVSGRAGFVDHAQFEADLTDARGKLPGELEVFHLEDNDLIFRYTVQGRHEAIAGDITQDLTGLDAPRSKEEDMQIARAAAREVTFEGFDNLLGP